MSWSRTHRRHQLVHAVLDDIEVTGQTVIPARWQAEVDAEFGDFGEFLQDVQIRWYRAFEARLDALLEAWPPDMYAALVQLWHDLAETMPAARFLLDAHADHEALAVLHRHHRRMLHAATGIHLDPVRAVPPLATPPSRPHRRRMLLACRWITDPGTSCT